MSQGTKMSGASDGAQNAEASGASDGAQNAEVSTGAAGPEGQELSSGEGDMLDPFAVQALEGKDNSLDAYSAAARFSLQTENPENAVEGGLSGSFLGVSRAYCFKKHLFSEWKECWDEISFVSAEGERGTERIDLANQLWGIGPAAGTDHYAGLNIETDEVTGEELYILTERDENQEKIREFPLKELSRN